MIRKVILILIILLFVSIASAANEYQTTYTIDVKEDGSAIWGVEYRTLLVTKDDFDSFGNYSQQLGSVYLPEFKTLMENSSSEAAAATSRNMVVGDFTGNAIIQTTPTGKYGIVRYLFKWTNFARKDANINIGDAFVGGLYLSKDNTLVIKYPSGFTVTRVNPEPDQVRDGLIWYGLRTFGRGEPEVVLTKEAIPWIPAFIVILLILFSGIIYIRWRKNKMDITETIVRPTDAEIMDLEDRIVKLLKENGGTMYQSEIGRQLDLPKSTISSALNELNVRKMIQKIKKGRENLIRLI